MNNLLKVTFFRLIKSKPLIIMASLAIVATLIIPIISCVVNLMGLNEVGLGNMFVGDYTVYLLKVYNVSYSSMATSIWIGPLFFVLLGMGIVNFINGEVRSGAIRNQITSGYSRTKVYYAHYIPCLAVILGSTFISQLLILLVGTIGQFDLSTLANGADYFYPRYFIGLVGFVGLLTLVFSFAIRFERLHLPQMMVNLIIPMLFLASNYIILLIFTNAIDYEGGISTLGDQFAQAISWIPTHQYDYIQGYSSAPSLLSPQGALPYFGSDYHIVLKSGISMALLYVISLFSGQLLYNKKEFK